MLSAKNSVVRLLGSGGGQVGRSRPNKVRNVTQTLRSTFRDTRRGLYHYDLKNLQINESLTTHVVADKRPTSSKLVKSSPFPDLRKPFNSSLSASEASMEASTPHQKETLMTKLPNGLIVASEETRTPLTSVGLYIKSGTRFESPSEAGMALLADRLMFKATQNRSHAEAIALLESEGMTVQTSAFPDRIEMLGEFLSEKLGTFLEMVSDSVLYPVFTTEDVQREAQNLLEQWELDQNSVHHLISNGLHEVAFARTPLAQTMPSPSLNTLTAEAMLQFMRRNWTAPRMVLAGCSPSHTQLVEAAKRHLSKIPAMPLDGSIPSVSAVGMPLMGSWRAQYSGGMRLVPLEPEPEDTDPVAAIALAFQGSALVDPDIHLMFALSTLLGGGDSFSSGGPGKGIHSRLYRNLLCQYHYITHCSAAIHSYADTSLFTILTDCRPNRLSQTLDAVSGEMARLASDLDEEQVLRAKNSLKASIFYNLENQQVIQDDIARYTLTLGRRLSAQEICDKIDAITVQAMKGYVRKLLSTPPVVVAVGPESALKSVPKYDTIERYFQRVTQT